MYLFSNVYWDICGFRIKHLQDGEQDWDKAIECTYSDLQHYQVHVDHPMYILLPYIRVKCDDDYEIYDIVKIIPDNDGNVSFLQVATEIKNYYHQTLSQYELENILKLSDSEQQKKVISYNITKHIPTKRYEAMNDTLFFEGLEKLNTNVYKLSIA